MMMMMMILLDKKVTASFVINWLQMSCEIVMLDSIGKKIVKVGACWAWYANTGHCFQKEHCFKIIAFQ